MLFYQIYSEVTTLFDKEMFGSVPILGLHCLPDIQIYGEITTFFDKEMFGSVPILGLHYLPDVDV